MGADLVKGLRGQLATVEEVEVLRAELAESRALRKSLETRLDELVEADAAAAMPRRSLTKVHPADLLNPNLGGM